MSEREDGLRDGGRPQQDQDVGACRGQCKVTTDTLYVLYCTLLYCTVLYCTVLCIPMVSARNSRTQGLRILKLQPDLFLGAMLSSAVTRVACLYCAASSRVVSVEDTGH